MVMETLTHPRHIRVDARFYAAQFFDRETGDVLAEPILDVSPDLAATALSQTASAPAPQRLTHEQYESVSGDQGVSVANLRPPLSAGGWAG
jgi:hypothetical protein